MQPERFQQLKELEIAFRQLCDEHQFRKQTDPLRNFLAPFAVLILLRWASVYESEQESLGGAYYGRFLPGEFNWKSWSQLRGNQLREFLQQQLWFHLKSLPNTEWGVCLRSVGTYIEIEHLPENILDNLVDWVDKVPLETLQDREIVGEVFTRLLQDLMKNQKYSGELFTPPAVVELMVELAAPKPGERIYDPCCGTGGLLAACANSLREALRTQPQKNWLELQKNSLFGAEINPILYVIGMVRVMLAGIDSPKLELGDTLESSTEQIRLDSKHPNTSSSGGVLLAQQRPQRRVQAANQEIPDENSKGFDCIIAVPPFGVTINPDITGRFPVKSRSSETLFLQHIMAALRPGGRAVVVLPEGILFRSGLEEQLRQILLEKYRVEGVISLPQNAFAPYTSIKTSILYFSRQQPRESVRFYEVSHIAKPKDGLIDQSFKLAVQFAVQMLTNPGSLKEAKTSKQEYKSSEELYTREIVEEFRKGEISRHLWETPIKNLAARGWELVAKPTGEDAVEQFLQAVRSADPNIPIKQLGEVAKVFAGMTNTQASSTLKNEESTASNVVRIVRIADIHDGKVRFPSLLSNIKNSKSTLQKNLLQPDDLLITRSGSVGKLGVVSNKIVDAVASNNLVVVRLPSEISSAYLSVLLHSAIYQEWLKGHAVGSAIQHLSIATLRQLPIPIPSLQVQSSVAGRNWLGVLDVTRLLRDILTKQDPDIVAAWLEAEPLISRVFQASRSTDKEGNLALLLQTSEVIVQIRNKITHLYDLKLNADPVLIRWLLKMADELGELYEFKDIPQGTARIVVLTNVKLSLKEALQSLSISDAPLIQRVKEFTSGLIELVDRQIREQVTNIRVEANLDPPAIKVSTSAEVILTLHNKGIIPIRHFNISTNPNFGNTKIPYLAEKQSIDLPLRVPPQNTEGMLNFVVSWSGKLLNGERIEGEIPLTIEIRVLKPTSDNVIILKIEPQVSKSVTTGNLYSLEKDLGTSPYIVGNPVDRESMFYGRSKEINTIRRQLATSNNANVILLEGNRRTGKTSILKYLQLEGKLPGWIVVECSFQGAIGDEKKVGLPTKEVFRIMAKQLGTAAIDAGLTVQLPNAPSYDPNRPIKTQFVYLLRQYFSEDYPFEDFELFLQSVLNAANPKRVLLLLDEFDKLQEGIDSGVTSSQVPENIRYLFQTYSNLSGIITGSRRLKRLREEYWSVLFGLGYRIGLDPLEHEEARQLVTKPVEGRLIYVPQARDLVVDLCACQPYLIQVLCNRIFERAAQNNERTITLGFVQAAADEMVRDNEHFRTLWDYAGTERRRYILSLCKQLEQGPDPVNIALLETKLEEAEVLIPSDERLGNDIEFLRELELLELDSTEAFPIYKLAIPLMADWIKRNVDHEDLRRKAVKEGQDKF